MFGIVWVWVEMINSLQAPKTYVVFKTTPDNRWDQLSCFKNYGVWIPGGYENRTGQKKHCTKHCSKKHWISMDISKITIVLYMGTLYHSWPLSSHVFFRIPNRCSYRTQRMGVQLTRTIRIRISRRTIVIRKNNSKNSNNNHCVYIYIYYIHNYIII